MKKKVEICFKKNSSSGGRLLKKGVKKRVQENNSYCNIVT